MSCKEKKYVLPYAFGELRGGQRETFQNHLKRCKECRYLWDEFKNTERILKKRTLSEVPSQLVDKCLSRIESEIRFQDGKSRGKQWTDRVLFWPKPVWRLAVVVFVFCFGFGVGKLVFSPTPWMKKYKNIVHRKSESESPAESRFLRNYLLSVEMLFLDVINLEKPELMEDDEWKVELEMTREILNRTQKMKNTMKGRNAEVYQLLVEIEWVLDDILGSSKYELADLSRDIQKRIHEQQLLSKIQEYTL